MNKEFSADQAVKQMLPLAKKAGVETVWDRFEKQQPQCGFGTLGICCRICWQGPCRIDPFGDGPVKGVCGADADTIVARNLIRGIAGGTAAHSDHGKHIALTLLEISEKKAEGYQIKDEAKLRSVADKLGLPQEGRDLYEVAGAVAETTLEDFFRKDESIHCSWFDKTLPKERVEKLEKLGVVPGNINGSIAEIMARTHIGTDADPVNLLLGGIKCALADYVGMALATDLSDAIFGTPAPVKTRANLGVIKESAVNIAVHGHNPLLSELVCDIAAELNAEAIKAGAKDGINVVGVCCTGNEVMMRRGIPLATNFLSQELAIVTGALDAMVVDVQCIMPSLAAVKECFHTELITTMPTCKISGATHVEFSTETAKESAGKIVKLAIEAYKSRNPAKVNLSDITETAYAGFSTEAIIAALSTVDREDPLKPLLDNIVNGNIRGVVLFAGCNNPNVVQDHAFTAIARELAENNVLMLATGCGAGAFAKAGLMTPEATEAYAGDTLKAVLTAIGKAAGLSGPLPLILHMGSCVDNTRAVAVATALANKIGVDLDKLPVAASAPECMSEKAMAIGTWAVSLGLPTHLGIVPQILGSELVTKVLTEGVKDLTGGYFFVETEPKAAAAKLLEAIETRRAGLGI